MQRRDISKAVHYTLGDGSCVPAMVSGVYADNDHADLVIFNVQSGATEFFTDIIQDTLEYQMDPNTSIMTLVGDGPQPGHWHQPEL